MEKNLCIPLLMVAAFVAILAALFAGPLTEDQPPVIQAYVGETLYFEYTLPEGSEPLQFSSDVGVEIRQQAGLDHGARDFTHVSFTINEDGIYPVRMKAPSGVSTIIMILDTVDSSPENPPADGPRDISRLLDPERAIMFRVAWVDDDVPHGTNLESPDDNAIRDYKLVFKSSDPAKGSVLFDEQSILKPKSRASVHVGLVTIDDTSIVLTIETVPLFIGMFPICIKINPVIPSDGCVADYLTMNGKQGTTLHFLVTGVGKDARTIEVHFKEKTK